MRETVLPGKLGDDCMESRFRCWRKCCGLIDEDHVNFPASRESHEPRLPGAMFLRLTFAISAIGSCGECSQTEETEDAWLGNRTHIRPSVADSNFVEQHVARVNIEGVDVDPPKAHLNGTWRYHCTQATSEPSVADGLGLKYIVMAPAV